jgi:hypothetical protein
MMKFEILPDKTDSRFIQPISKHFQNFHIGLIGVVKTGRIDKHNVEIGPFERIDEIKLDHFDLSGAGLQCMANAGVAFCRSTDELGRVS